MRMIEVKMQYDEFPEEIKKIYYNKIIAPDPFISITNMLAWHEDMNPKQRAKMDDEAKQTMELFKQFFFMPQNIAKAKTVYLDKDLMPSILNTDNKIFFRNTGLPVMFINEDFKYKNNLIKGILIANAKDLSDHMDPGTVMEFVIEGRDMKLFDSLLFMWVYIDYTDGSETWMSFTTNDLKKYPDKARQNICKFIGTIACNIIDFMNQDVEDIDINIINTTHEENNKRIRKGKPPIAQKVYIRPKSEVRNYYINFNKELEDIRRRPTHRYLVRGFWRHYRSDKRKNVQGKSIWVKCYIRGKGIFIEKKYKLED